MDEPYKPQRRKTMAECECAPKKVCDKHRVEGLAKLEALAPPETVGGEPGALEVLVRRAYLDGCKEACGEAHVHNWNGWWAMYGKKLIESLTPPIPESEPVDVVAAVRRNDEGHYWICKRDASGKHAGLAGMWEYPGGKVEEGEQLREALIRELQEEFGWGGVTVAGIELGQVLDSITYGPYRVTFFDVAMNEPTELRCHTEARWMTPDEVCLQEHLPSGTIFNARHLAPHPEPEGSREALEEIAEGSRASIGECDWCGEAGLPPRHKPNCPTIIAINWLTAHPEASPPAEETCQCDPVEYILDGEICGICKLPLKDVKWANG